jgi:hypothetical protein
MRVGRLSVRRAGAGSSCSWSTSRAITAAADAGQQVTTAATRALDGGSMHGRARELL